MAELRYESGNVKSPYVHRVGILAIGSHLENHGAALPIDTDSKIASYIALQASLITGAKFLGVLYAATEYPFIDHGKHLEPEVLVEKQLIPTLKSAKKCLDLDWVVLVNGHGGNNPVKEFIETIQEKSQLKIVFNNKIVEIEGPHAGTGEISIAALLGFLNASKLDEHCEFDKYPEVGMVGLEEARKIDSGIDKGAREVENLGVCVDMNLGESMLETAIVDVIHDIEKIVGDK
ncbi:2-amino-5-formylamino-6-ribosylaminopyrimidin-4(3H)-one 5'-monophosphate deformylase [Methanobacterium spitsbergense]|uniref:2-amino-5-formylamino-6-ribosylaminopyrimidin-4(3H)-one 5'-monophosphate deformylase n=1 Tax=Methanobacterium spitsbergense TaxID=2874285 RepID=A0A8T5UY82_9EURY|nr:2-amino-5-formylamino-6-ribosylaminopyrimidin-4(3H)-one 5'-monophosphate deformylase [Methanobacterium spitsbergense]